MKSIAELAGEAIDAFVALEAHRHMNTPTDPVERKKGYIALKEAEHKNYLAQQALDAAVQS